MGLKVMGFAIPIRSTKEGVQWSQGFSMDLPMGAELLTLDAVGPQCVLYALVDTDVNHEQRDFRLVNSCMEHELPSDEHFAFVGTFGTNDRSHVFHLFETVSGRVVTPATGKRVN